MFVSLSRKYLSFEVVELYADEALELLFFFISASARGSF
jgi:hypothetical protein